MRVESTCPLKMSLLALYKWCHCRHVIRAKKWLCQFGQLEGPIYSSEWPKQRWYQIGPYISVEYIILIMFLFET